MHTSAVWWQVSPAALEAAFHARWQALDGFLGAAYALHHVAALLTLSERHDLGRAVGDGEGTWFASVDQNGRGNPRSISGETVEINERQFVPTVFLYDNYPGGIGLSAPLFDLRHEIVSRTIELVQDCGCLSGCPACVGPILGSDESKGYAPKQAALTVLNLISTSRERRTQTLEAETQMSLAQRLALLKGNRNPSPNTGVRTDTAGSEPRRQRVSGRGAVTGADIRYCSAGCPPEAALPRRRERWFVQYIPADKTQRR